MKEVEIAGIEQGVTRLFALSLTAGQARALRDDRRMQASMLGLDMINALGIEIFALSDLGEMGLLGYLREGVDARPDDLKRDRIKLMALEGWVLLVHSMAFEGKDVVLTLAPEITLIGTYPQQRAPAADIALESAAAQPYSGVPDTTVAKPAAPAPRGSVVVVCLALMAALILWWALA